MKEENKQKANSSPTPPQTTTFKKGNNLLWIIISVFVILIIGVVLYYYFSHNQKEDSDPARTDIEINQNDEKTNEDIVQTEEEHKENDNVCPPYEFDDNNIETEENPDEVVETLNRALKSNDYEYIISHMHCDKKCQQVIFDELGVCMDKFWELDKRVSEQKKEVKILELSTNIIQKTEDKAKYEVESKFTHLEPDKQEQGGTYIRTEEYELLKVGKRWKMDLMQNIKYTLGALSHYQAMFNDLDKCKDKEPIEYTAPVSDGHLEINNAGHPLNGLKIDFPTLKEPLKVKIACLDKYPTLPTRDIHITLPISIEFDKDLEILKSEQAELFKQLLNKEDYSFNMISQTEFRYTLPYYDIGFNDETGFAHINGSYNIADSSRESDTLFPTEIIDAKNNYLSAASSLLYKMVFADTSMEYLKSKKLKRDMFSTDADHDGLADHIEEIFGADKNNSDTDKDGYLDGDEVKGGYSPAGSGNISKETLNMENKILYTIAASAKDTTNDISRMLSCSKIYSYDVATEEIQELTDNADGVFYLSSDNKKVIYENKECTSESYTGKKDAMVFDLETKEKKVSERVAMIAERMMLWKDIYLQREYDGEFFSENYSLVLYNQNLNKKTDIKSFSGNSLITIPSNDGNYLFCSGYHGSYRIDLLKDKLDKEYDFESSILYVTPDGHQLAYLKQDIEEMSHKIYIYNDQTDTSKRLTDLDKNYQESIIPNTSLNAQGNKKLLFFVYKIDDIEKIMGDDNDVEFQLGIYDPSTNKIDYIKEEGLPADMMIVMNMYIAMSPDGSKIAYFDSAKKKLVIYSIESKSIIKEISTPDKPSYLIWY